MNIDHFNVVELEKEITQTTHGINNHAGISVRLGISDTLYQKTTH